MFRGTNHINVDSKYRVAIPARYRELLLQECAGKLVANIDINRNPCIALYPVPVWEEIEESVLQNFPRFGQGSRAQRLLLSRASEVDMDSSGRVLLPPDLREHIKLDKKAVILGNGKKFEVWRQEDWQRDQELGMQEIEDNELVEKIVSNIRYI
ncbi:MAG: division/cell wall cluster transcriptional repressor MraZ [Pseudomonadales bacterium]